MDATLHQISVAKSPPAQPWTDTSQRAVERLYIGAQGTLGDLTPIVRVAAELKARGYDVRVHLSRGYGWLLERFGVEGADDQAPADLGEEFQGQLGLWNAMKAAIPLAAEGTYRIVSEMAARRAAGHRDFFIAGMGTNLLAYPLVQAFLPDQWAIIDPIHFADGDSGFPSLVFQDYKSRPAWVNRLANRFLIGLLNLPPIRRLFVKGAESVLSDSDREDVQAMGRLRRARYNPSAAVFRLYLKNLDGSVHYANPRKRVIFGPQIAASTAQPAKHESDLPRIEHNFFEAAAEHGVRVVAINFSSMKPHNDPNVTGSVIAQAAEQLQEAGDAVWLFYANTQHVDRSRFNHRRYLYMSEGQVNWPEVARRSHGAIIHGGVGSSAVVGVMQRPCVAYYRVSEQRSNALRCGALRVFPMKDLTVDSLVSSIRLVLSQPRGQDWSPEQLTRWMNSYQLAADEIERQLYEWAQVPA